METSPAGKEVEEMDRQELTEAIITTVVSIITVITVICAAPEIVGSNGAWVCYGQSMEPTIMMGDMILSKETPPSQIEIGDIIFFKYKDSIIGHRVIEESDDNFKTKGDNSEPDPWIVPGKAVIGTYRTRIPYFGYLVHFIKSKWFCVFASLIGGYLMLIAGYDTYTIIKGTKKAAETTARKTKEGYDWLKRLVTHYHYRGEWWRGWLWEFPKCKLGRE